MNSAVNEVESTRTSETVHRCWNEILEVNVKKAFRTLSNAPGDLFIAQRFGQCLCQVPFLNQVWGGVYIGVVGKWGVSMGIKVYTAFSYDRCRE